MRRLVWAMLPVAALLLTSCSWTFSSQKSDLQMAEQAAKIAGDDDAVQRAAPIDLLAKATPVKPPLKPVPSAQPKVMISTTPAKITEVTAVADIAMVKPLAAGPVAAPIAAAATPMATGEIDATDVLAKVPVNGTAIHLASYRELASAKRGWQILSKSYRELVPLKPLYVAVNLPGKGHILRLYGTGSDASSLKTICSEMHAEGAYCASNIAF